MPAARPLDKRNKKLASELVCGENLCAVEEWNEDHAQENHYEWLRKVDLDELHPVVERLSGSPDESDRTRLSRHDREADGSPGKTPVCQEVPFDTNVLSALPESETDYTSEVEDEDRPVDDGQWRPKSKVTEKRCRRTIATTV